MVASRQGRVEDRVESRMREVSGGTSNVLYLDRGLS